jgi:hypothetical protein
MPLPIDISALLSGSLVESERMELKEGWNPESVLHTLSSVIVNYPGPDRSVRLDQFRQGSHGTTERRSFAFRMFWVKNMFKVLYYRDFK